MTTETIKRTGIKVEAITELERIRITSEGILHAEDVVAYAKNSDSALHGYFEWDNTKASHAYRVYQARKLIRAVVTILPNTEEPIPAYFSLKTDRYSPEHGYRAIVDVLSDEELYQQLLRDALADYLSWERKYKQVKELEPIFEAAKEVKKRIEG